jgi:hypothetical protein
MLLQKMKIPMRLKYGAKRRHLSIFGASCPLFNIPFWFRVKGFGVIGRAKEELLIVNYLISVVYFFCVCYNSYCYELVTGG